MGGLWNLKGTAILANAPDMMELENRLKELGVDPAQVVQEYLPPPEQCLGGSIES